MAPNSSGARARRTRLLHEELTDRVLGGFYQVYNELGFGYAESVYSVAMYRVLTELGLHVQREVPIAVWFRGEIIGRFRADLVVEDKVLLELKSMRRPDPSLEAQTLNLLRSTRLEVGLLLYFNEKPVIERLIFTNDRKLPRLSH